MNKKLLSLPFIFWSAMFVIVPLCMVFYYGLTDKSGAFTLDNILAIATRAFQGSVGSAEVIRDQHCDLPASGISPCHDPV